MKKQFLKVIGSAVFMLVLGFAANVSQAQAQSSNVLKINIPFDFTAGTAKLSAGEYTIRQTGLNSFLIRGVENNQKALVTASLSFASNESVTSAMAVFNRYGEQYFLSEIWSQKDSGRALMKTSAERNAEKESKLAKNETKRIEVSAAN